MCRQGDGEVALGPEVCEMEGDGVEGHDCNPIPSSEVSALGPHIPLMFEDPQRMGVGVDQSSVTHAIARIERHLDRAVFAGGEGERTSQIQSGGISK